jgi:acetyl esterase/lipase
MPNVEAHQYGSPFIEWFIPSNRTTDAVLILTCGGGYGCCNWQPTGGFSAVFRDWLLERGLTVVRLHYRTPRPKKVEKHVTAWQDAQRAVRLVRSAAAAHGVDGGKIGFCGYSAAGHLTLLMALSSQTRAYEPVDGVDALPCNINWAVSAFPAYVLSDGENGSNAHGGNRIEDEILPLFKFDSATCPVFFMHGDADSISPMASVKVYSRLHAMGVPSELHVYAKLAHDFKPTGADKRRFTAWRDSVWNWLIRMGLAGTHPCAHGVTE